MMTKLTPGEKDTLVECEKIIERGQKTFVEVGLALCKIRDRKLYRLTHDTFEEYCRERWGWSRQHAGRLIESASVLKSLPPKCNQLVTNEAQARAVAGVPAERREAVLEAAAATGSVTARTIGEAATALNPPPPKCNQLVTNEAAGLRDRTELGRPVPDSISALWAAADATYNKLIGAANLIKSAMASGIDDRETNLVWLECNNTDVAAIQQVINTLTLHVRPHALCPTCSGTASRAKCRLCRGRGFIGRHLWQTCVSGEQKAVLARS